MNKILVFFKNASPLILIMISVGIGICAKLLELRFANFAMGLQLICFAFFCYGLLKFFNNKFK